MNSEPLERTGPPSSDIEFPRISHRVSAPLYEIVKRQLTEAIVMGKWEPGTVLPSEVALSQMLGVAVGTVRRALGDLTSEGLISRRRKIGTVVTGRSPHHTLRFFFQYFRLHRSDGTLQRSQTKVLRVERITASPLLQEKLNLAPGAQVIELERIRSVDGRAVMHDAFALDAAKVPDFPLKLSEVPDLLYIFLLEEYGIRISSVREELRATLATAQDCELLSLQPPAALLSIEETAFDQTNLPTIYGERRASTENHIYINEVR